MKGRTAPNAIGGVTLYYHGYFISGWLYIFCPFYCWSISHGSINYGNMLFSVMRTTAVIIVTFAFLCIINSFYYCYAPGLVWRIPKSIFCSLIYDSRRFLEASTYPCSVPGPNWYIPQSILCSLIYDSNRVLEASTCPAPGLYWWCIAQLIFCSFIKPSSNLWHYCCPVCDH